jgi:hypothetical protein
LKDKAFGKKKIIDRKNEVFTLSLRGYFLLSLRDFPSLSLRGAVATKQSDPKCRCKVFFFCHCEGAERPKQSPETATPSLTLGLAVTKEGDCFASLAMTDREKSLRDFPSSSLKTFLLCHCEGAKRPKQSQWDCRASLRSARNDGGGKSSLTVTKGSVVCSGSQ